MARNYSFYICPFWQSAEEYTRTIIDGNNSKHFVRKDERPCSVTFKYKTIQLIFITSHEEVARGDSEQS